MLRRWFTVAGVILVLTGTPAVVSAQVAQPAATPQARGKQQPSPATKKPATTRRSRKQAKQVAETPPPPPPPPPTPEQMPAVVPEVVYRDGLLTINARNSTMNDVLAAVRRVTGATIEKPPVGGSDRVVAHLGPGQPKDVLQSLFNGSRYDFIILGSTNRPGGVEKVILTAKASAGPANSVAVNNPTPQPSQPNVQQAQPEADEPEADTEDMTVPERDQAEPEQQEQPGQAQPGQLQPGQPQPVQPGMPGAQPANPQGQNPQGQNPAQQQNQQPQVKSPEELLRELQQMQKQPPDQNQQQQEQNPQ